MLDFTTDNSCSFEIFASQLYPLSVVSFQANGYYLKPYYDEVVKERQEREAWDKL